MNKPTRAALQFVRFVLALLSVLWILSWLGIFLKIAEPGFFAENWMRVLLGFAITFIPVIGYTKLTKFLESTKQKPSENNASNMKP